MFKDRDKGLRKDEFFSETKIHPSAIVERGAELGIGVEIGAHAVIGQQVKLDDGVKVGVGASIQGKTSVGKNTKVFDYSTLGTAPQDLKYMGENTELKIGSDNLIREYVNISLGTQGGGGVTRIGNKNLIMVYTHIAHDCQIGNQCIFANSVQLAGHVIVDDFVVFGGMSGGHQFCQFGELAMIGAGSVVVKDVPPFCLVQGDRAKVNGLNVVGLRRMGIRGAKMDVVKKMYRILYRSNLTVHDACLSISESLPVTDERKKFLHFLEQSERGICR